MNFHEFYKPYEPGGEGTQLKFGWGVLPGP